MKIKKICEDYIEFDNGTIIVDNHNQECCEHVYADWDYLRQYNTLPQTGENISIFDINFDDDIHNHIEYEKEMGIKLVSKDGNKWFIPCYNSQNGYYGSDLSLKIQIPNKPKITIDISDYVKDDIC